MRFTRKCLVQLKRIDLKSGTRTRQVGLFNNVHKLVNKVGNVISGKWFQTVIIIYVITVNAVGTFATPMAMAHLSATV